ncbi:MAG: hypothetical protein WBF84_12675 [Castellaniella sp.]|uniref:hypothetical protein n=1 Tax=Castellaniella sp. TaxID=1955812 RepID=UPI003C73093E
MSIEAEKEARAVTELMHLYAPSQLLLQIGFVDADGNDFEAHPDSFEDVQDVGRIEMVTLALYYACGNGNIAFNYDDPKVDIIKDLRADPIVIANLIRLSEAEATGTAFSLSDEVHKEKMSARGRKAVKARHSKPGSKTQQRQEMANKLIELWRSGKYTTRDICAEQEWEALGFVSFRSARRALTNR